MVQYILTGATGGLGSQVFNHLIRLVPASDIVVSLYNPAGATPCIIDSGVEIRRGDFSEPESLNTAFNGGDVLLIVSYPSIAHELRVKNHTTAIDAAKRTGVKHIYYTSLMFADDSQAAVMQAHLDTEKYLKESGLTYTIIREGIYSESYPLYFGYWNPSRGREVKIPYGDGGIAWVCREDLGEGTAKAMVANAYPNEIVRFTGSKAWTLAELAQLVSGMLQLEPPLELSIVPVEDYVASNSGGKDLLTKWSTTYPALQRGELAVIDPLLQKILGRQLKPFEETVREMLGITGDAGEAAVGQYSK